MFMPLFTSWPLKVAPLLLCWWWMGINTLVVWFCMWREVAAWTRSFFSPPWAFTSCKQSNHTHIRLFLCLQPTKIRNKLGCVSVRVCMHALKAKQYERWMSWWVWNGRTSKHVSYTERFSSWKTILMTSWHGFGQHIVWPRICPDVCLFVQRADMSHKQPDSRAWK